MQYQHTNTSHNRSSGFSSVAEIAGGGRYGDAELSGRRDAPDPR